MSRRFWLLIWLVGLVVGSVDGQGSRPPADLRFGVVEAFWHPQKAAELGVGWERILFYWDEIQPAGSQDWNTLHVLEEWLREADSQGRQIVGLLEHTPAWATDGNPIAGVPRGLYLPIEDPQNLWANYVGRIADYYGPLGVHHWIIWNEPDITPEVYGAEFEGSVADYYQLVKVAYQVMKASDPQAVIHLAGLTYWHDVVSGREQYLRRFLQQAATDPEAAANGYFFDLISLHIYFRVETIPTIIGEMVAIQQEFGLDKPIWVDETNAAPTLDPLWPVDRPQFPVDLEQQAWFIIQAYALGFAAGADSMGVYKFSDVLVSPGAESFGLLRADFSERPAFRAYQTTIRYLAGFNGVDWQAMDKFQRVTFHKPDGLVHILWARTPAGGLFELAATASTATLVMADGQTHSLTASNHAYLLTLEGARCQEECLIGGRPLMVVETIARPVTALPPTPLSSPIVPPTVSLPSPVPTPTLIVPAGTPQPTESASLFPYLALLAVIIAILVLFRHHQWAKR